MLAHINIPSTIMKNSPDDILDKHFHVSFYQGVWNLQLSLVQARSFEFPVDNHITTMLYIRVNDLLIVWNTGNIVKAMIEFYSSRKGMRKTIGSW